MVEKLFEEQKQIISEVEKDLKQIDDLEKVLRDEKIVITDEVDEKGKKKYANDDYRQQELIKRLPKEAKLMEETKNRLEINRMKFDLNKQMINFYNK